MKEYFIRGQVFSAPKITNDNDKKNPDNPQKICPIVSSTATPYQLVQDANLRVEIWDKDERFDDRLGSAKTDSQGVFEIKFTDEDFRQDFLDFDIKPEIFFQVFRGRQLLFVTEDRQIEWDENNQWFNPVPVEEICYAIRIEKATVTESKKEQRQKDDFEESPIKTVDILPTSDQVTSLGRSTTPRSLDSRTNSLEQIVNNAFSQVLGRNLNADDSQAFQASLTQAFTPQEGEDGRTNYVWTPRAYATQTDLGGSLSGAQASLYHRAKAALNEMLPLLKQLKPLDPAADNQNMEAMRSIVQTQIVNLVNELGAVGGARVQRVDNLFQQLLGNSNSINLGGQLRNLAQVFSLNRDRINTVDEEQNYSNFLIIKDYLVSLQSSWNNFVEDSGGGAFIGTQLVLLSQALAVAAESVQEVYQIMDLVFLGPNERDAVEIDFTKANDSDYEDENSRDDFAFALPDGTGYPTDQLAKLVPSMSIEELLQWVWIFATEEGPSLARAGGKLGISEVIAHTAEKLMILVQAASFTPVRNTAFQREGVKRALRDLAFQLYRVQYLAEEVKAPTIGYQPDDLELPQSANTKEPNPSLTRRNFRLF